MYRKLVKLSQRHKLSILMSVLYELFIRLYRYSCLFRKFSLLFIKTKKPEGIFFVVGSYNAGTTLIKNVIASHPNISAAPIEGDRLTNELNNLEEGGWHRCLYGNRNAIEKYRETGRINPHQLLKDWAPWIKDHTWFLEKSIANSVRIKLLGEAFPDSKFINVIRSPVAVTAGIKRRSKPTRQAREQLNADVYPDALLYRQWAYIYGLICRDAIQTDIYHCSYEKFILAPAETTQQLFAFLALPPVDIHYDADLNTLSINGEAVYIRPLPLWGDEIPDYSDPEILAAEIEKLTNP